MDEMTGKKIDRYEILARLGAGGMGAVYKAHDTHLDRMVAIKVLASHLTSDETASQRFLREAKTSAKLRHSNIVTVYDFAICNGIYYLVMDYIEGKSLEDFLKETRAGIIPCCKIIVQILSAIGYAHEQNIIHRDIKPSNILLDANGVPYVSDFGLAKALSSNTPQLSHSGAVMGTPTYMSPEQAAGDKIDTRSDIYSLGAVFYEMLTGRPPFEGDSVFNILFKLANEKVEKPRKINPKVPPVLDRICLKALDKNRDSRYQTAGEMAEDIQQYLQQPQPLEYTQNRPAPVHPDRTGGSQKTKLSSPPSPRTKKTKASGFQRPQSPPQRSGRRFSYISIAIAFSGLLLLVVGIYLGSRSKPVTPKIKQADVSTQGSSDTSPQPETETGESQPTETGDSQPAGSEQPATGTNESPTNADDSQLPNPTPVQPDIDFQAKGARKEALEAFNQFRAWLRNKENTGAVELCSEDFLAEDIPEGSELRDAFFKVYSKKLLPPPEKRVLQGDIEGKLHAEDPDNPLMGVFYMIFEGNRWKYDGTELERLIRTKNLIPCEDRSKYEGCYQSYEKIAEHFQKGKGTFFGICSKKLSYKWQKAIVMMRGRRVFRYSYVLDQELRLTTKRDIVVFRLSVAGEERKTRLVLRQEMNEWKVLEIR